MNSSSYGLLSISEVQDLTGEDVVSKYAKGSLYVSEGEVPTENVRLFENRGFSVIIVLFITICRLRGMMLM